MLSLIPTVIPVVQSTALQTVVIFPVCSLTRKSNCSIPLSYDPAKRQNSGPHNWTGLSDNAWVAMHYALSKMQGGHMTLWLMLLTNQKGFFISGEGQCLVTRIMPLQNICYKLICWPDLQTKPNQTRGLWQNLIWSVRGLHAMCATKWILWMHPRQITLDKI